MKWWGPAMGVSLMLVTGMPKTSGAMMEMPGAGETTALRTISFASLEEEASHVSNPGLPDVSADAVLIRSKEWDWHRYAHGVLKLPNWVDLGFENRTRFEGYDHPWRPSQPLGRTDSQIQQRSRVRIGVNAGMVRFLVEGQDSRVFLNDRGDFVNTGSRNEFDIVQVFMSVTVRNIWETGLRTDLHVGRLTMDFGRRRLIARNDFRNTTNAFDGVHWQIAKGDEWRFRAFLVEPVLRQSVELDEQSRRNVFWGGFAEYMQMPWLKWNVYYFGLNDQRSAMFSEHRTYSTFGLRLFEMPKKARMDYEIESVWQIGRRGRVHHFASFFHVDIGFTFDIPGSPRLLLHYDYASGDRDPGDKRDSAFDTLFGARRFELAPTGNFGPFFRTNIHSPGWRVMIAPITGMKLQLKHRVWYLATSRGEFDGSGLREATGSSGNFLGHDVELRLQWSIARNVEFDAGYDHWFKGGYFDRLPAGAGLPPGGEKDSDYLYILTKLRF